MTIRTVFGGHCSDTEVTGPSEQALHKEAMGTRRGKDERGLIGDPLGEGAVIPNAYSRRSGLQQ